MDDNLQDEYDADSRSFDVIAEVSGERLDCFCARISGETRSFIQKLIEDGLVAQNGRTCAKPGTKLRSGDRIEITLPETAAAELIAEDIPLKIIYQDSDIAVIDKPKGMVVHPAPGNSGGTLVNAAMHHIRDLSGIGGELRPGIVHRLDKLTSGLVVIAKNDAAHRSLSRQFHDHSAHRIYAALVDGNLTEDSGVIDAPIGRHPVDRKRMAVVINGREAVTRWRVIERYGAYTLILAALETGRTHQIRVHMAHIKHPVAGDGVYDPNKNRLSLDGQALHAARLMLEHPRTGEKLSFSAPLPDYLLQALKRAGHENRRNEPPEDIEAAIARMMDEGER